MDMLTPTAVHQLDGSSRVFVLATADGHQLDAVVDDSNAREPRLVISTLLGCPIRCAFCDAGAVYEGRLTRAEMLAQVELLAAGLGAHSAPVLVDFSRMGEPAFNDAVLDVLEELPRLLGTGVKARISTVVPARTGTFFDGLERVKRAQYPGGRLLLRFSLHATDPGSRSWFTQTRLAAYEEIARLGRRLWTEEDEKIELYFAAPAELPLDPSALRRQFSPETFRVTLAELRPTSAVGRLGLASAATSGCRGDELVRQFCAAGYDTRLDTGNTTLDAVGASCGMYTAGGRESGPRPRRTLRR